MKENEWKKKGLADRRRHKVFVTQNTEYHLRDDICVAVRDTREGMWSRKSKLLSARLMGAVDSCNSLSSNRCSPPEPGKHLLFMTDEGELLVTTRLENIERPPKEAVQHYIAMGEEPDDSSLQYIISNL
jgi:hypothetical protein